MALGLLNNGPLPDLGLCASSLSRTTQRVDVHSHPVFALARFAQLSFPVAQQPKCDGKPGLQLCQAPVISATVNTWRRP